MSRPGDDRVPESAQGEVPITDRTWILSCPACGRWKTLAEAGGVRIGARSVGKRILGYCSGCGGFGMFRLERPAQIPHDHLQKMVSERESG